MIRRVGVLTGGGDVPGLNSVIKGLVRSLTPEGREVVGLRRGWASLLHIGADDGARDHEWMVPLDRERTRRIDRTGGTFLHSSRVNPALLLPHQVPEHLAGAGEPNDDGTVDLTAEVCATIEALELDALVAIGGDGTLSFASRLHQEGVQVLGIPKTMDNDVYGTDYSIGFSTAVTRSVNFIDDLRTVAGSHERFLIVELFGRNSGEPCLLASYLADADRALIAEHPFDRQPLIDMLLADKRSNPSGYAVLTVSEGAHEVGAGPLESGDADAVGNRKLGGIGSRIADMIREASGERAIYQPLGYLMRSGPPDALDRLVAQNFARLAAEHLLTGETGMMTAVVGGRYAVVSLDRVGEGVRRVDVERFYDTEAYRPRVTRIQGLPMFLH